MVRLLEALNRAAQILHTDRENVIAPPIVVSYLERRGSGSMEFGLKTI